MNDAQEEQIINRAREKHLIPGPRQLFHLGMILLTSLIVGLTFFRFFASMPSELTPEQEAHARGGLGVMLGLALSLVGTLTYTFWNLVLGLRVKRDAMNEIVAKHIEELKQSGEQG